jgi:hypothetical protein
MMLTLEQLKFILLTLTTDGIAYRANEVRLAADTIDAVKLAIARETAKSAIKGLPSSNDPPPTDTAA